MMGWRRVMVALCCTFPFVSESVNGDREQDIATFSIGDDLGDVALNGESRLGAQNSDEHLDLSRIEIWDDEDYVRVTFVVRNLEVGYPPAEPYAAQMFQVYRFHFTFNEMGYTLETSVQGYFDVAQSGRVVLANPTGRSCQSAGADRCADWTDIEVKLAAEQNAFVVLWPKLTVSESDVTAPRQGDDLSDLWGEVEAYLQSGITFTDRAPEAGSKGPYKLTAEASGRALRVRPVDPFPELPLAPGRLHTLDVNITNRLAEKRIVGLNATWRGNLADLEDFMVQAPRAITVPANQTRTVRVYIDVAADAPMGARVVLDLQVASLTAAGEKAHYPWPLMVAPGIGPESRVLFAHAEPPTDCTVVQLSVPCAPQTFVPGGFLSLAERDSYSADPDAFGAAIAASTHEISFRAATRHASGIPLVLEPRGDLVLAVDIESRHTYHDVDARFQVTITPYGRSPVLIGEVSKAITIGPDEVPTTMEAVVKGTKELIFPRGSLVQVFFSATLPPEGATAEQRFVIVHGGTTRLTLPLIPPPPDPAPPSQGAFQVRAVTDGDRFLNPGETTVFHVGILNQLVDPQRATIEVDSTPTDWEATVEPGLRFDFRGGESIILHVKLRAPPDAAEGARAAFNLTVSDELGRRASLLLRATAVTLPIEDEASKYSVDPDAAERLVPNVSNSTPALGIGLVIVAAMAAGRKMRQRSG